MRDLLAHTQIIKKIDSKLKDIIGTDLPIFKRIRNFVIKSGGKRIRPLLHYHIAHMLGYSENEWRDVGAIGELIHAASLLHDDVIDEAQTRRYRPSINSLYGNKTAILSGDYLLSCGLDHLTTLKRSLPLLEVFTRAVRMLATSELLQMRWEKDLSISEKMYNRIIMGKTASLFGCMAESAAILADEGNSKKEREKYRQFGERLGRIFQIRDDYLDYYSDEKASHLDGKNSRKNSKKSSGKSSRSGREGNNRGRQLASKELYQDFRQGSVTRPIILLRQSLQRRDRTILAELFSMERQEIGEQEIEKITSMLEEHKIAIRIRWEIEEEIHALLRFLRRIKASNYRDGIIEQLASLLIPK